MNKRIKVLTLSLVGIMSVGTMTACSSNKASVGDAQTPATDKIEAAVPVKGESANLV